MYLMMTDDAVRLCRATVPCYALLAGNLLVLVVCVAPGAGILTRWCNDDGNFFLFLCFPKR